MAGPGHSSGGRVVSHGPFADQPGRHPNPQLVTATDAERETTSAPAEEPHPAARAQRFRRFRSIGSIRRIESPVAAALLSYLLPGLGHLGMGRRRAAALFLVPSLIGLGWIAIQLAEGVEWFGASLFDVTFAATLIAILAFLAVWRILALGHAFATAPGRHRFRKLELAMTAALVASIVVTHAAAVAGAWAVYETGAAINSNNMLSDSLLSGTAFATPSASASPTPSMTQSMEPYVTLGPTPAPAPAFWTNPDRITFLLIGVDFMTGRSHALTDTMILATLDVHTNKATLISVPRDTSYFPLYFGPMSGETFKLNELMSAASNASFGSPDSGVKTLENEIGFLVGLPVDYYAAVDLEGFVKIVQALGGVDIDVKTPVNDPFTGTFVPTGMIHMDGHLALKYSRSREGSSDYARSRRQQEVLIALAHKVVSPDVVPQLTTLLPLAWSTLATDFPMKYARNFITAFRRVGTPTQCVLGPPYNWHPDSSLTDGTWTSRLDLDRVAGLSVYLFGSESTYSNKPGVVPAPCAS